MKDGIASEEDKSLVGTVMYRNPNLVYVGGISAYSEEDEAWYVTTEVNTGIQYVSKRSQLEEIPSFEDYFKNRKLFQLKEAKNRVKSLEADIEELR